MAPGLSLEERYPSRDSYVSAVGRAAATLRDERFLLAEDADRMIEAASKFSDVDPR